MAKRAFAYSIALSQVGPVHDPDWLRASPEVKAEVKRWVVVFGLKEKDADLAQGLDRKGVPLGPVSAATRKHRDSEMGPADPSAPALMPAYAVSRTRLLLEGEPTERGAQFWWGYDPYTGGDWGEILDHHRRGIGRRGHKVRRDVIGLSEAALARVRQQVMARWSQWKLANLRPGWSPPAAATVPPPRLRVIGRTDYENYIFGIGATGRPGAGVQATGFFRRRPGEGLTAFGGPDRGGPRPPQPPPAPKPKPAPKPPAPAPPPPPPKPAAVPPSHPPVAVSGHIGGGDRAWSNVPGYSESVANAARHGLTREEVEAVWEYGGSRGFSINSNLRTGASEVDQQFAAALDRAINKLTLSTDETLYRALRHDPFAQGGLKPRPGDVFADNGFSSTSRDRGLAESVGTRAVLIRIDAPSGSVGLDLDEIKGRAAGEEEVLLPRYSRFKVVRKSMDGDTIVYDVLYLGPGVAPERPRKLKFNYLFRRSASEPQIAPDPARSAEVLRRARADKKPRA